METLTIITLFEWITIEPFNNSENFRAIKPEFKGLLSELCTEQILMLIKPNEVRSRKKQRKLGTEVADLKQKLSQSNKNIVLSNREIRLLR